MPRLTSTIENPLPVEWVESERKQRKTLLDRRHYDRVIGRFTEDVFDETGSLLLRYCPKAIAPADCDEARASLRSAGKWSTARGLDSGIVGYYDSPKLRPTAFTEHHPRKWLLTASFLRTLNDVFRRQLPERYKVQRAVAYRTDPRWTIGGTAFTTATVNRWDATHDCRFGFHPDANNLPEGFGCMTVLRRGTYSGGLLIFPRYRIAVDLGEGDVLFFPSAEYHGNGPIVGEPGWERISVVAYYRAGFKPSPETGPR